MAFYEIQSDGEGPQGRPPAASATGPDRQLRALASGRPVTMMDSLALRSLLLGGSGAGGGFGQDLGESTLAALAGGKGILPAGLGRDGDAFGRPALPPMATGPSAAYIPVKWLTAGSPTAAEEMGRQGNWYWASGDGKRGKGRWIREGPMVRWLTDEGEAPVLDSGSLAASVPTVSAPPVTAGSWRITRGLGPNKEQNLWMTDGQRKIWLTKGPTGMQIFYWSR